MTAEFTPAPPPTFRDRVIEKATVAPWAVLTRVLRALYGLRIDGWERMPSEGPFILMLTEPNLFGMLLSGWLSIQVLLAELERGRSDVVAYFEEELFRISYFRNLQGRRGTYRPLRPTGGGSLALNLLDGFQSLRRGGIVIMNPEGDAHWDGRPIHIGHSLAWLALHTAAPIVPALVGPGTYDIWPRWRATPSRSGELIVKVGEPFRLCDSPQAKVTDEDIEKASEQILAQHIALRYGPGGLEEWAGAPLRDGAPVQEPFHLMPPTERTIARGEGRNLNIPVFRRGIPQLLWRCPVCGTHDALVDRRPLFRGRSLRCLACATRWEVRRVVSHDFRLKVVEGPEDVVGLDMALSRWYDEMKRAFLPTAIQASGVALRPGEEVYLETHGSKLMPHRPNQLLEGWAEREAPQTQPPGEFTYGDWGNAGTGRLLLTNQRLIWQDTDREVDFLWPSVNALSAFWTNMLMVQYGVVHYRLGLGKEPALKWLIHAATAAQQEPGARKLELKTSRF